MSTLEQVAGRKLSLSEFPRSEPPRSDPVRPEPALSEPPRIVAHCVVVDAGNSTVVSIGTQIPSLMFVRDSLMDTLSYVGVVAPEVLEIKASDPRAYPEWSFDYRSRTFSKTNPAIITEGMCERAVLATIDFAMSAESESFDTPDLRANVDRFLGR